ncbi:FtsQ-type POTRA domain-containing protein [Bifidobacterium bifidum]|uniref:Cell division protein n=2 Tax=Bifidobacterium bifidum TaxID=1681 RepID=A0A415C438_BIFBI|nr:FtsQ-type POTRA domain-containing protein [Bifidobacterium bifidum]KAB5605106.1 FtsQ-type POTRA domain-containing protein [Bifidobacterium bifidum]KAB7468049.1 FtsQ-type POTRA domain-containing protein [Bifidobacterium bifidum]KAB7470920.1 FtsQ-type POTRA domain-containing protein [Bifidobacterium bifidum]KAB7473150.1 FtsQ-type POTRA domain-containing protein [Bifidobacterium bifidum]
MTRERQTRKKPRTASNDVSRKAASGEASPGRTTVGKATGRQMTSGRKSEKALEKETSRQVKGGKTVSRKSRFGKTASRSVSSSSSRSVSRAEGFVDARRLHSEDVVKKTLDENVGVLGVATRPKVLDFDARLKERKKAGTRVAAIRVLIVILAAALVSALIWLLLFSSVFRLETSQISVSGGNEWVSEKDVLDIANQQSGKSLFLVSADKVSSQLKNIPGVTQANVVKRYPRSLEIDIKAQQPAAMLKEPDGTLVAVDRKARVLNAVGKASMKGIPVIEVSSVDNGLNSRAVKEALTILGGLPDTMRTVITKVSAKTQDSITTELSSGKYVVVWGDSSELKLKSAIVDKLLSDPSLIGDKHQIDVSAPSRPIIK